MKINKTILILLIIFFYIAIFNIFGFCQNDSGKTFSKISKE